MIRVALLMLSAVTLGGCGYHVAGTADTLPTTIKTIAVPPFSNMGTRYRLTDRLPNMIAREFISRTRYQVVQDAQQADAVLQGSVNTVTSFPMTYDAGTGRAASVEIQVILSVDLKERLSGKTLFHHPNYNFRQRYEISTTPGAYFDESTTAFDRLAKDVARTVVSAVLENF